MGIWEVGMETSEARPRTDSLHSIHLSLKMGRVVMSEIH